MCMINRKPKLEEHDNNQIVIERHNRKYIDIPQKFSDPKEKNAYLEGFMKGVELMSIEAKRIMTQYGKNR